jgi:hypothetical protein
MKSPIGIQSSRRDALLLASGAMIVATTLAVLLSRATLDDAYITFRYARHLAKGMDSAHGTIPASTSKGTRRCYGCCCSRAPRESASMFW